jgi:hypothetical protein
MNTVTWSGDELAGDVEGALAFDRDTDTDLPPTDWTGGGGGALLGVGYEAWVGDQWSLGGVARVLLVSGTLRDDDDDEIDSTGFAPAILFVATHH